MGNSIQQNDANGVPPLAGPIGSQSDLDHAITWIQILLNLHESPPGERWHIKACAEEFVSIHKRKQANRSGESPAPEGRVVLDPLDVPLQAARQDGGSPDRMSATRSVGDIAGAHTRSEAE